MALSDATLQGLQMISNQLQEIASQSVYPAEMQQQALRLRTALPSLEWVQKEAASTSMEQLVQNIDKQHEALKLGNDLQRAEAEALAEEALQPAKLDGTMDGWKLDGTMAGPSLTQSRRWRRCI